MVYLISNVTCSRVIENVNDDDEIIFFNHAANFEVFESLKVKKSLFVRETIEYGDGHFCNIPYDRIINEHRYHGRKEWYGIENEIFSDFDVIINLDHHFNTHFYPTFHYPFKKWATSGFIMYNFFRYLGKPVTLVNFFPKAGPLSCDWDGHDWDYEDRVYRSEGAHIIDLR